MEKIRISEEMKIQDQWYKEARSITVDELPGFISKLLNDYQHDYGTVCHALTAAAIAAASAMNKTEQGGITGFQAGAVMWQFIRQWNHQSNKCGMKLVDFDKILYPQYGYCFDKTITDVQWKSVQEAAHREVEKADRKRAGYIERCKKYEVEIANFVERHPDYYFNPEYYKRLSCGTGAEWDAYYAKEKGGFEFAPDEPCDAGPSATVYQHWLSICSGKLPFGFSISAD